MASSTQHFERARSPESYAHTLAHAFNNGYRIYDPSLAASKDPTFEKKLYRFPSFFSPLQVRHSNIAGSKWTVAAPDEGGDLESQMAAVCARGIGNIDRFTDGRINLARADVSGARYAEVVKRTIRADYGGGMRDWTVPTALLDLPKENFRWRPDPDAEGTPRAYLEYARKKQGTVRWVRVKSWAPLVRHIVGDAEERLGYGFGLQDALYFIYMVRTRVFEADARAAERLGHGWLVLKMDGAKPGDPAKTNATLVKNAKDEMNKMRAKHNFVIGSGDELQFLAPPSSAADWMNRFGEALDRMADRVIMGASLFAGGGSQTEGSFARAETEADTASTVFDLYRDRLDETLTRDLVVPFIRDNWQNFVEMGLGHAMHPTYSSVRGRKRAPQEAAQTIEILLRSGVKLKADQVYDLVDMDKPGEGDDVIEGQQAAGPGGGLEGLLGGGSDAV